MRLSKPVIAAVEGYAVAGGLELALWCDLRVAAEDAVFGVFCRRWGVPLVDGGTVRLPRLIGSSRALDMILTGRPVAAPEAFDFGLANRVVPHGEALFAAQRLARELAAFPQTCLRNDRRSVLFQAGQSEPDALAFEFSIGRESIIADGVDGAAQFAGGAGRHGLFARTPRSKAPPRDDSSFEPAQMHAVVRATALTVRIRSTRHDRRLVRTLNAAVATTGPSLRLKKNVGGRT